MNSKLKNYTRDNVRNRLEDADPYTVIQMLMQGVRSIAQVVGKSVAPEIV